MTTTRDIDDLRRTLERHGALVDPHGSGLSVIRSLDGPGTEELTALVPAGWEIAYTPDGFTIAFPDDDEEG